MNAVCQIFLNALCMSSAVGDFCFCFYVFVAYQIGGLILHRETTSLYFSVVCQSESTKSRTSSNSTFQFNNKKVNRSYLLAKITDQDCENNFQKWNLSGGGKKILQPTSGKLERKKLPKIPKKLIKYIQTQT